MHYMYILFDKKNKGKITMHYIYVIFDFRSMYIFFYILIKYEIREKKY